MTITQVSVVSRRRFLVSASVAVSADWVLLRRLIAADEGLVQQIRRAAATAKISVQRLRGNISVLIGAGGNIAVLPSGDGKLLIDAGIPASRSRITEGLAALGPEPIKHLINTHWHFDHTDGNGWLHSAGATILAHENTLKHLATTTRVEDWNFTFPPSLAGALPTILFKETYILHLNGAIMSLGYYQPAHTDSDIFVHFTEADVLHTGDTWWNGFYPFIDYSTGGSIDGMIRAAESNLAMVTPKTVTIPGHGAVGNRSQLVEYCDMLVAVRAKIAGLKQQGRSLDEAIPAKPTADYDAKWGSLIPSNLFTKLVYTGV